jgi:hypothetical protein
MSVREALQSKQNKGIRGVKPTLATLLISIPFLIEAVVILKLLVHAIFLRNETTYPEGVGIYAFLTTLRTGHLYSDPFQPPWNAQQYGPVFYFLGSVFAKLAHGAPMLTTELIRALSFLAFLGSVGLAGYLAWRLERRRAWVAFEIVLGLACVCATPFCASARADALSIFFILAALAVYQVAEGRTRLVFWAGVLGALGFLTKQSVGAVLLALAIDSVIAKRFRDTAALIGGSAVTTGLILSVLWLRHEPFLANFGVIQHASVQWPAAIPQAIRFVQFSLTSVVALGIAMVGVGQSWRDVSYRPVLLAIVFGCISSVAGLAIAGADANYLILPWFLVILMVPAGLGRIEESAQRSVWIPVGLTMLTCLFLFYQRSYFRKTPAQNLVTERVGDLRMLSDWPYLELRSRDPILLDPYFYHQLSLQGVWSIAPILASIDAREYDLILINGSHSSDQTEFTVHTYRGFSNWGPETLNAMQQNYQALCEVPGFIALVPKDRPDMVREENISEIFQQPCLATMRQLQIAPGMR